MTFGKRKTEESSQEEATNKEYPQLEYFNERAKNTALFLLFVVKVEIEAPVWVVSHGNIVRKRVKPVCSVTEKKTKG